MRYGAIHDLLPLRQQELDVLYRTGQRRTSRQCSIHTKRSGTEDVPQPNIGEPGAGDLTLTFFGDAGVVGRADMVDRT